MALSVFCSGTACWRSERSRSLARSSAFLGGSFAPSDLLVGIVFPPRPSRRDPDRMEKDQTLTQPEAYKVEDFWPPLLASHRGLVRARVLLFSAFFEFMNHQCIITELPVSVGHDPAFSFSVRENSAAVPRREIVLAERKKVRLARRTFGRCTTRDNSNLKARMTRAAVCWLPSVSARIMRVCELRGSSPAWPKRLPPFVGFQTLRIRRKACGSFQTRHEVFSHHIYLLSAMVVVKICGFIIPAARANSPPIQSAFPSACDPSP